MPVYGFKQQFIEPIKTGTKGGTIRVPRKIPAKWSDFARNRHPGGHASPGETLFLYYALRTRQCQLIAEKLCLGAAMIGLHFAPERRVHIILDERSKLHYRGRDLDEFARFDGFESFDQLEEFWKRTHGAVNIFDGWHIRWLPLPHEVETFGQREIVPLVSR